MGRVEQREAMSDDRTSGVGTFLEEVRRSMLIDASKKIAWWVIGSLAAAVALVIWQGGTVPTWTLLLTVVVLGIAAIWWRAHTKNRITSELESMKIERDAVADDADAMAFGLERHETYSRHVAQALDALQRVVSQDINVSIPRYIEQAILEPARDLLMEKPAEHVRLSVLLPRDLANPTTWWMPWAAGHSLPGRSKYAEQITDTLSRRAFEEGEGQHWPDVETDSGFKPNPKASEPIRTLVSLPVRHGDRVLGVFNVVSSEPDAFDPAELTYISSLGAVLSVAVGVYLKEQLGEADAG